VILPTRSGAAAANAALATTMEQKRKVRTVANT